MKIGVFDSGVGGVAMANTIKAALPEAEIVLREDKEHLPYGSRRPDEILNLVMPILQEMFHEGCEVIVIACNTVTTTLIKELRGRFPVPLVAIEPMVKPAAELTRNKVIAVCATPTTLASDRYKWLKETYAIGVKVLEPDCHDWAKMIEDKTVNKHIIQERINEVLAGGADVIVLACTHYHWIEEEIKAMAAGRAVVLQPEEAILRQLKKVLAQPA